MKAFVSFSDFFHALYGRDPFPWQRLLAERGAAGRWPQTISLPTASGKTASLDAAVYALAAQATLPLAERQAPRRIWFVVDRRIVVDEAHDRAMHLATKLARASSGPVKAVADRLRLLTGGNETDALPLAVAKLRGGSARDDTWAYDPAQPAVLCSTVDQIGSSLLFRSYTHDPLTASIWAGLAAHDSLILLDEAHCAVPFLQTLRAVAACRDASWALEPVVTPFACTVFSATLPPGVAEEIPREYRLPRDPAERIAALDHPVLAERLTAPKPTTLVVAPKAKKDDPRATLAATIVEQVKRHVSDHAAHFPDAMRFAVMVNRVATAQQVAAALTRELANFTLGADIVLLTGRMRPLERDALVKEWIPRLRAGADEAPSRPVIVVTTQCLEVGADFSFDALVTECASLDALRQRFGRLDRLGKFRRASATIVITEADTKEPKADEADPIYGRSIFETWQWLQSISAPSAFGPNVDFGVTSMDTHLERLRAGKSGEDRLVALLAPSPNAPVLLPAHLDLLCQTAPRPKPEPDVALFLHGKKDHVAEVRVLWRADLPDFSEPEHEAQAIDQLALVPPTSVETISVPLPRLKAWFARHVATFDEGDVEGSAVVANVQNDSASSAVRAPAFLIWAGPERSRVCNNPREISGGDTIVLSTAVGLDGLAQSAAGTSEGLGAERLDLAEPAALAGRSQAVLRLQNDLWSAWSLPETFQALLDAAEADAFDRDEFHACWGAAREISAAAEEGSSVFPSWLPEVLVALGTDPRIERIDGRRGLILVGPRKNVASAEDIYADEMDERSQAANFKNGDGITLAHHSADVTTAALHFSRSCLPGSFRTAFELSGPLHDLGKMDARFQVMLHGGDDVAAETSVPLAKSAKLDRRRRHRIAVHEDQRLPRSFRHELLSLHLVEQLGLLAATGSSRELSLHLIASHHGHARPFAPSAPDTQPPVVDLSSLGLAARLESDARAPITPFGQTNAQLVERFWILTRRHGWWGLAYLEAVFRLADWHASRWPSTKPETSPRLAVTAVPDVKTTRHHLTLPAIDGANPLGFLSALGVLRVLSVTRAELYPALSWTQDAGRFVPRLTTNATLTPDALVNLMADRLSTEHVFPPQITGSPERQKLKIHVDSLRQCLEPITKTPSQREFAGFWAAFFSETSPHPKDGSALKTRFDFHSGQMKIVENVATLRKHIDASVLRNTLFDGWRYVPQPSLRWNPLDEKRLYALQANDPSDKSKNPILTDIGANLLAIEAMHYFPMSSDRFGSQAGFNSGRFAQQWTWPLWEEPLGADAVFSLLHADLETGREVRRFRSRMGEAGKGYRTFSPARPV